jgi:hypothetical protein
MHTYAEHAANKHFPVSRCVALHRASVPHKVCVSWPVVCWGGRLQSMHCNNLHDAMPTRLCVKLCVLAPPHLGPGSSQGCNQGALANIRQPHQGHISHQAQLQEQQHLQATKTHHQHSEKLVQCCLTSLTGPPDHMCVVTHTGILRLQAHTLRARSWSISYVVGDAIQAEHCRLHNEARLQQSHAHCVRQCNIWQRQMPCS